MRKSENLRSIIRHSFHACVEKVVSKGLKRRVGLKENSVELTLYPLEGGFS